MVDLLMVDLLLMIDLLTIDHFLTIDLLTYYYELLPCVLLAPIDFLIYDLLLMIVGQTFQIRLLA